MKKRSAYFVIGEAFVDVSEGGLRCVRVWVDTKKGEYGCQL
jgi:hypothetical protein